MADLDNIDLQAELEKCTALLALINDARAKEKVHKAGEQSMLNARNEIFALNIKLQAIQDELNKLRARHGSESNDHTIKKTKWQEKNVRMERIAFRGGGDTGSDSGEESDLDERAKLMQENLNLLLQQRSIKELSVQMKQKQHDIDRISSKISDRESVISTLEPNAAAFALAVEKVNASRRNDELASAQETIKSQATEIESLKKSTDLHIKKNMQLTAEVEDQNSLNRQQQKLIAPLLTQVRSLQDFEEDKSKTVAENMKAAYEEGRKYQYRQMAGPYDAGCAVRGRKLAWICSETDGLIIGLGNKASHYGMVLADAAFFTDLVLPLSGSTNLFRSCWTFSIGAEL
ncbi:hypothetical protein DL98DRAFT_633786 [Cadophora sp. DSE1049]|nr:hypothetical protein DL98DRAFT_633786 [Cadophora sp. DSE1049]